MPVLIGAKQNDEGAESDQQSGEPEKMYFHGDLAALIGKHSSRDKRMRPGNCYRLVRRR